MLLPTGLPHPNIDRGKEFHNLLNTTSERCLRMRSNLDTDARVDTGCKFAERFVGVYQSMV